MKQGKGVCKHGPYVAAAFGLQETANEFLCSCICTTMWAKPPAQALVQTSQTGEAVKLRGLQSNSQAAKCCVVWGMLCFALCLWISISFPERLLCCLLKGWIGAGRCSAWDADRTVRTPLYPVENEHEHMQLLGGMCWSFCLIPTKEAQKCYLFFHLCFLWCAFHICWFTESLAEGRFNCTLGFVFLNDNYLSIMDTAVAWIPCISFLVEIKR